MKKIGYVSSQYPDKRCIIGKVPDMNYLRIKRVNDINFLTFRFQYEILHNIFHKRVNWNWNIADLYRPFFPPKCDIVHTFNVCCDIGKEWCVTFESTFPRTNNTIDRVWEKDNEDYQPDKITLYESEIATRKNCKGLIALSNNAFNIQKNMLKNFPEDIARRLNDKTSVLLPPQKVLISKKELDSKFNNKNGKIKMVFVGNDFFRKGGDQLVDVLEQLKSLHNYNFSLTVISTLSYGDYASQSTYHDFEKYSKKLKKLPWITWYKNVPNDKVLNIMKKSHLGFLPTLADTFGYSVLEMQATGCPVVTTNIRELSEINNVTCGWICKLPKDNISNEALFYKKNCKAILRKELVTNLTEILTDPSKLYIKAQEAIKRIEKEHNPQNYAKALKKIYEK